MQRAECRSCKAPIIWVKMQASQKNMPLDAEPAADGNVAIVNGEGVSIKGDIFAETYEPPFYKSHFATCPWANKHRKESK